MILALGCVYALAMAFFSISFLVEWIKSRKQIRRYLKYGAWFGAVIIGLDLFIIAISPSAWDSTLLIALVGEPIVLIRMIGFTMLGMYYAAQLSYPSFPILLRKFGAPLVEEETNSIKPTRVSKASSVQPESSPQNAPPESPVTDLLLQINWREYAIAVFGVSILGILYSSILFLIIPPTLSEIAQQRFGVSSVEPENAITIQGILLLLEFAIAEEIVFRLGIQNFLAKYLKLEHGNYWIAVVITSALWTLGHAGILEPEWVKLAQIFPIGLLLGWLYRKYGAESTMLAHGVFNLTFVFLSVYLIR